MTYSQLNGNHGCHNSGGESIPVVLIPGLASDHRSWIFQSLYLRKNYRVINFDGRPGVTDFGHIKVAIETMVADLSWSLHELGIQKTFLVGCSMGAAIALEYASKNPDAIHGLVLSSLPLESDHDMFQSFASDLEIATSSSPFDFLNIMAPYFFSENFIRSEKFNTLCVFGNTEYSEASHELVLAQLKAVQAWIHEKKWKSAHVTCPCLVLYGSNDKLVLVDAATDHISTVAPKATIEIIHGAGHSVHIENPKEFNERIDLFFDSCLAVQSGTSNIGAMNG